MIAQNIFFIVTGILLALAVTEFIYHRMVVKGKNVAITRQLMAWNRLQRELERLHTEKDMLEELLKDKINKK